MTEHTYSLKYFNKIGKIELCRLMFAAANVPYEDNYIEKLTDTDSQVGHLPYLKVDFTQIPCISVICRFLAREFHLDGKTNIKTAKMDAVAQTVMLFIDKYYTNVNDVDDLDTKKIALRDYLNNDVENAAVSVERLVKLYCQDPNVAPSGFAVGDTLSYADLFIYELLTHYFPYDADNMESRFPHIYAIRNNVGSLPNIIKFSKENSNHPPRLSKDAINDL